MAVERVLIEAVRDARETVRVISLKVKTAQEVFKTENAVLLDDQEFAKEQVVAVEATLREAALVDYALHKSKQPGPGLGIRVIPTISYEPDRALAWAKEHGVALSLDLAAFKKQVQAGADGTDSIAKITDEPQATIASDLAAALDAAEVPR